MYVCTTNSTGGDKVKESKSSCRRRWSGRWSQHWSSW